MSYQPTILRLPVQWHPVISHCGHWRFGAADSGTVYCLPTHCVHQYDYAGEIWIGEHHFLLQPGDVTFTPANVPAHYRLAVESAHWGLHFQVPPPEWDASPATPAMELPLHLPTGNERGLVADRMRQICDMFNRPASDQLDGQLQKALGGSMLQELFLSLSLARHHRQKSPLSARMEQFLVVLRERIEGRLTQPLTVPRLARELGVSQNYLSNAFRRRFNLTIPRYILIRRVERAKQLLRDSSRPIHEIATLSGMPDSKHFCKQFRLLAGASPQEWRLAQAARFSDRSG